MDHSQYFAVALDLYFRSPPDKQPEIVKKLVEYGNFQDMVKALSKTWVLPMRSAQEASKLLEFFMKYITIGRKSIEFGLLRDVAKFYFKLLEMRAEPPSFQMYNKFLAVFMNVLKNYECQSLFDQMIKLPCESGIYPLAYFGTVVPEFNVRVGQILFNLMEVCFKNPAARVAWMEGFIHFLAHKPDASISKAIMLQKIEELLERKDVATELRLKLLYFAGAYLNKETMLKLYNKFYETLLKDLTAQCIDFGMAYVFSITALYYSISDEKDAIINQMVIHAIPFFHESASTNSEAVKFAESLSSDELQKFIEKIGNNATCIRATMFFVSRFPTSGTVNILFKTTDSQYRTAQYKAMIYYLDHNECPSEYVVYLFSLLKVADFNHLEKILKDRAEVYCTAVIKYLHFCYETEKLTCILGHLLDAKVLPVIDGKVENAVLTVGVHYFGFRKLHKTLTALLQYLVACHEQKEKTFDIESAVNGTDYAWPYSLNKIIGQDEEWCKYLTELSLGRLQKQENQQCLILAAINCDDVLLHNSALLLLKDERLLTLLFCSAVTKDVRTALVELRRLLSDNTAGPVQNQGFFTTLLKDMTSNKAVAITPVVLKVLCQVAACVPFSQLLVDVLITAFPLDQPSNYLTISNKAVEAVCSRAEGREIIHHVIERMCSKVNGCDVDVFIPALICALNHNQTLTESLAMKVAETFMTLIGQKKVADDCTFEIAFCDPNYGEMTQKCYLKQLENLFAKQETNECVFRALKRIMKVRNDPKYFQRFYPVLIAGSLSKTAFIRRFCLKSLDRIDQIGFTWPSADDLVAMVPYDILATVEPFFDQLVSKFTFEASLLLNEMLVARLPETVKCNQVSITLFFYSVMKRFGKEYLSGSKLFLPHFFKAIRKVNIDEHPLVKYCYSKILVTLAKFDPAKLMIYVMENCSMENFPRSTLRLLFNIPEFITEMFKYITRMLKTKKEDISIDILAHVSHFLQIFAKERLTETYRDNCLTSVFILIALTYVTFTKWAEHFRGPHIQHMTKLIRCYLDMPVMDANKLPVNELNTRHNLIVLLRSIIHRIEYQVKPEILAEFEHTEYEFMKYYIITVMYEYDSNLVSDLIRCFDNDEFVATYLPKIVTEVSGIFDYKRLKECDESVISGLTKAVFVAFEEMDAKDLSTSFGLFLRLLLVSSDQFILANTAKIMKSMNNSIIADPNLVAMQEFSNVLFRLVDLKQDPTDFVAHFDSIILKMAASLLSNSKEAVECAEVFFKKLFCPKEELEYNNLFASIASLYTAYDKSPKRYVDLATNIVKMISMWDKISIDQIEKMGTIVRPLLLLNDAKCRQQAQSFVTELQRYALTSDVAVIGKVMNMISEFASPAVMRVQK